MIVCNCELFWIITWNFSLHYWFAKSSKYIFKQHLRRFPYVGCKLCTHRCVCVSTINTSFTEEQVSRNLRIRLSTAYNDINTQSKSLRTAVPNFLHGSGDLENCEVIKHPPHDHHPTGQTLAVTHVNADGGMSGSVKGSSVLFHSMEKFQTIWNCFVVISGVEMFLQ